MPRLRACWWLLAALAGLATLYHPVLGWGPVAEDFQFALKGARARESPGKLLHPLQLVWRPLAVLPFLLLRGPRWLPMRALHFGLGLGMACLGFVFFRRLVKASPPVAALLVLLWLTAPLSTEVLCGETAFVGHLLYGCASLVALLALAQEDQRWRWVVAAAASIALLSKEEAVVLPAVVFLTSRFVLHRSPRLALRDSIWAAVPVAVFIPTYFAITGLAYRSFYGVNGQELLAKMLVTAGSFFHLLPPTVSHFAAHLAFQPWRAALTALVVVIFLLLLLRSQQREAGGWLLVTVCLLLPTLPSAGQAARWTFLPWLTFIAACTAPFTSPTASWARSWLSRAAGGLAALLVATNSVLAVGDVGDWGRFEALTRRLEGELEPLLQALRNGVAVVVWREHDDGPLQELVFTSGGSITLFFPRPEDPYGIVSLEAMLGWRLHREGRAVLRVSAPAPGALEFVHRDGGFYPLPPGERSHRARVVTS
ncbi:MAG: hypothetical protein ACUVRQ_09890 [Thermoanaerobaculaceae bacterium]